MNYQICFVENYEFNTPSYYFFEKTLTAPFTEFYSKRNLHSVQNKNAFASYSVRRAVENLNAIAFSLLECTTLKKIS